MIGSFFKCRKYFIFLSCFILDIYVFAATESKYTACKPFNNEMDISSKEALNYMDACRKEKKYDDTLSYVKFSAQQGDAEGLFQLAMFYMNPLRFHEISVTRELRTNNPIKHQYVEHRLKEAEKYFLKAYQQGHKKASWWLGHLYMGQPHSDAYAINIKEEIDTSMCQIPDKVFECILEQASRQKRKTIFLSLLIKLIIHMVLSK